MLVDLAGEFLLRDGRQQREELMQNECVIHRRRRSVRLTRGHFLNIHQILR
jgi:hypothetical protein